MTMDRGNSGRRKSMSSFLFVIFIITWAATVNANATNVDNKGSEINDIGISALLARKTEADGPHVNAENNGETAGTQNQMDEKPVSAELTNKRSVTDENTTPWSTSMKISKPKETTPPAKILKGRPTSNPDPSAEVCSSGLYQVKAPLYCKPDEKIKGLHVTSLMFEVQNLKLDEETGDKVFIGAGGGSPVLVLSSSSPDKPLKIWIESNSSFVYFNPTVKSSQFSLKWESEARNTTDPKPAKEPDRSALEKEELVICIENSAEYDDRWLRKAMAFKLNKVFLDDIPTQGVILYEDVNITRKGDSDKFTISVKKHSLTDYLPRLTREEIRKALFPKADNGEKNATLDTIDGKKLDLSLCAEKEKDRSWLYFAAVTVVVFICLFGGISYWQQHGSKPIKPKDHKEETIVIAHSSMVNPIYQMDEQAIIHSQSDDFGASTCNGKTHLAIDNPAFQMDEGDSGHPTSEGSSFDTPQEQERRLFSNNASILSFAPGNMLQINISDLPETTQPKEPDSPLEEEWLKNNPEGSMFSEWHHKWTNEEERHDSTPNVSISPFSTTPSNETEDVTHV